MDRPLQGSFRDPQTARHFRKGRGVFAINEECLHFIEVPGRAIRFPFRAQTVQHGLKQRLGPAPIEGFFRREMIGQLVLKTIFGRGGVEGEMSVVAAALLPPRLFPIVGQKMIQRSDEERAEAPFARVNGAQRMALQEAREKFLGQVLSVMRIFSLPPHVAVERMPVSATELLERRRRFRRMLISCAQDHAPMRRDKRGRSGHRPQGFFGNRHADDPNHRPRETLRQFNSRRRIKSTCGALT